MLRSMRVWTNIRLLMHEFRLEWQTGCFCEAIYRTMEKNWFSPNSNGLVANRLQNCFRVHRQFDTLYKITNSGSEKTLSYPKLRVCLAKNLRVLAILKPHHTNFGRFFIKNESWLVLKNHGHFWKTQGQKLVFAILGLGGTLESVQHKKAWFNMGDAFVIML